VSSNITTIFCQDFGSAFKNPWSTFRSYSSVREYFLTSETFNCQSEEASVAVFFISLLGVQFCFFAWGDAGVPQPFLLFTQNRVTKNDKETIFYFLLMRTESLKK